MSISVADTAVGFAKRSGLAHRTIAGALALWLFISLNNVLLDVMPVMPGVAGVQSVDQYLLNQGAGQYRFTAYDAYQFMNRELPVNSRVLLWESRGYYLR